MNASTHIFWYSMILGSVNFNGGHTYWGWFFYVFAIAALVIGVVHRLLFSEKILCTCCGDELKIQGIQP